MNDLEKYVDGLFRNQYQSSRVKDFKEEILSNMIAKRDDLLLQGMDETLATEKAKQSLSSIDGLLEDNQLTDISHYHMECLQSTLLNCIIFWILSLPLLFTGYSLVCFMGLISTSIVATLYFIKSRNECERIVFVSISANKYREKWIWRIWILFFTVYTLVMLALTFGSNLWFGQPIKISGPYDLANILTRLYVPLITIIVPITISGFSKLLIKNEKRYEDE